MHQFGVFNFEPSFVLKLFVILKKAVLFNITVNVLLVISVKIEILEMLGTRSSRKFL